ncbi:DUF1294 domain-containing protein [Robiginitomaculum antarcticum]|uniref:DUF1294 domain-containing protein n=1 Tax=Robiginitomaculum antarcticum TaxID=437507 RepID=UPI00389ABD07
MAALGGSPGSMMGQRIFRHKTRKQPFKAQLYTIAVIQIGFCIALGFAPFRNFVSTSLQSIFGF